MSPRFRHERYHDVMTFVTVPGPITALTVEAHNQEVVLAWQQPESPNGVVLQYVVYYSFIGQTVQVAMTTTVEATVDKAMSRQGKLSGPGDIDMSYLGKHFVMSRDDAMLMRMFEVDDMLSCLVGRHKGMGMRTCHSATAVNTKQ